MEITAANRVQQLPPYLFSRLNDKKKRLRAQGVDLIDLGIGDPDLPPPEFIQNQLIEELKNPANHRYSTFDGCQEFREAVVYFYKNRFNVDLDPDREVLTLIGSKEGLAHYILSLVNPGDRVLVPDPGYPAYRMAIHLAGGTPESLPLNPDQDYAPDWDTLQSINLDNVKLGLLNYPSNPTGGVINPRDFQTSVDYFKSKNIWLAHDSAYNLVTYDEFKAPSILQAEGAKDVAVEFGSLSKAFNMTGWRIGYVVGNSDCIQLLKTVKSNLDSCQFLAIQKAAAKALKSDLSFLKDRNEIYRKRGEVLLEGLAKAGIEASMPKGSIFLWVKVPERFESSEAFCDELLEKAGVVISPGNAFGSMGEGYFRLSLSLSNQRLKEAAERIQKL